MDVSHWEVDLSVNTIGTREKKVLIEPATERRAFFKIPREGTAEHWVEKIASEIAHFIGFPCQNVEVATFEGVQGALCYNFLNYNEELTHGSELLFGSYDNTKARNLALHTIDRIKSCLDSPPYGVFADFLIVPVFDALIGNTDRHAANWGVIYNVESRKYRMAPLFDNGSSLGWQYINADHIQRKLGNSVQWKNFIFNKSFSAIRWTENKITHFKLLEKLLVEFPYLIKIIKSKMKLLTDDVMENIVMGVDNGSMPHPFKKLVIKILKDRRNAILELVGWDNDKQFT